MLSLRAFALLGLISAATLRADPVDPVNPPGDPLGRDNTVLITPSSTSIYVGVVSLATTPLQRREGVYASRYTAKVFPYFFWSEAGRFYIDVSDELLRKLEKGDPVDFGGHAICDDGDPRQITGHAVPTDAGGGKIKVRIFVTKHIVLTFNTTYRFGAGP